MTALALIFTAPSGAGKTTLAKHMLATHPELCFSISATTRKIRDNIEKNKKDYYFLTQEAFCKKIEQKAFVEWEQVYDGFYYGTLKSEVSRIKRERKNIVFDVDVKGALKLKKYFTHHALSLFIHPPSIETLEQRLKGRGTNDTVELKKRLDKARQEMKHANQFDRIIMNDHLDQAKATAEKYYIDFTHSHEKKRSHRTVFRLF